MRINHIAILAEDIECLKEFYEKYFHATAGALYHNPDKKFSSYFLSFPGSDVRLEITSLPDIVGNTNPLRTKGFCHLAISVGNRDSVDALTWKMKDAGISVINGPRTTGDGYYESVIADPEGNIIEITE